MRWAGTSMEARSLCRRLPPLSTKREVVSRRRTVLVCACMIIDGRGRIRGANGINHQPSSCVIMTILVVMITT